jgi:hypothetical protein
MQKIEVYLIILMGYLFIFIFYEDIFNYKEFRNRTHTSANTTEIKYEIQKESKKHLSNIELIKHIDTISQKLDILILEAKIMNTSVELKTQGEFKKSMNFLITLQNNFTIKSFEILKDKNTINTNVILDKIYYDTINSHYRKNLKIVNPFIENISQEPKISKYPKITAIVSSEVLVNGNWYTVGDTMNSYKIVKIHTNTVTLLNLLTKQKVTKEVNYE